MKKLSYCAGCRGSTWNYPNASHSHGARMSNATGFLQILHVLEVLKLWCSSLKRYTKWNASACQMGNSTVNFQIKRVRKYTTDHPPTSTHTWFVTLLLDQTKYCIDFQIAVIHYNALLVSSNTVGIMKLIKPFLHSSGLGTAWLIFWSILVLHYFTNNHREKGSHHMLVK